MKLFSFLSVAICSSLFSDVSPLQNGSQENPYAVYLAGPLFTIAERQFNKNLAQELRDLGYTVFLPQEEEPREISARAIFEMDVSGIDRARAVVAILDGPDPDSGTCWECGYAYAKGKPVVAVRTDFRNASDGGFAPYNLMLSESASQHVHLPSLQYDLQTTVEAIDRQLQAVFAN